MHVLGFTDKIPEYFRAVDLLVTKAGPGTLAEANAAQLPVVVYDYVPGQERGNVDFVRHNGLGRDRAAAARPRSSPRCER